MAGHKHQAIHTHLPILGLPLLRTHSLNGSRGTGAIRTTHVPPAAHHHRARLARVIADIEIVAARCGICKLPIHPSLPGSKCALFGVGVVGGDDLAGGELDAGFDRTLSRLAGEFHGDLDLGYRLVVQ